MTQLEDIFEELGLTQYLDSFLEQGFDTWETCLDIRETDFDALHVKLGHRRKLERRIAAYRGVNNRQALARNKSTSPLEEDSKAEETSNRPTNSKVDGKEAPTNLQPTGKRKYRRHAKPDENAPERPPSAYVIFSNKMRDDLKGRSLSFTEIAKLVGENWQILNPSDKEPFEQQAFAAKEKYAIKLAEYRQTEEYRVYSEYLAEFKAKQQYQLESSQDASNESSKRPKLENLPSQSSTSTVNSISSSAPRSEGIIMETSAGSRGRLQSIGSVPHNWITGDVMAQQPPLPGISEASGDMGHVRRASIISSAPSNAWREQTRPLALPIQGYGRQPDQRPAKPLSYSGPDSHVPYIPRFASQPSSAGAFTPPLLTSESTASTLQSSVSSGSHDPRIPQSHYYGPRTPLEDPLRNFPSLPIPSIYANAKLPVSFEGQLPPIRHASLSPPTSQNVAYQPGPTADYQGGSAAQQRGSIFPVNRFPPVTQHNRPPQLFRHKSSADDIGPLDPIRALIDAGEIINSQGHQLQQKQSQHLSDQQSHHHHQRQ